MTDELRAKFEAWVSKNTNWSLSRSANDYDDDWGPYIHERTACAWLGYQEAHASRDAEVEALRKQLCTMESERDIAKAAYASSEAATEAMRADAERYRWLQDKAYVGVNMHKQCLWTLRGFAEGTTGTFSEDIDAAMAKESGE